MLELDRLRTRFGQFLVILLWLHVLLVVIVAMVMDRAPVPPALAAVLLAGAYHLSWWRHGIAPVTRYLSAASLMGEPALLVYVLAGHNWQMDLHMYFFATLALTIGWCDWRVILMGAIAVAVHHLLLDLLIPWAVFPHGADVARVCLHVAIVVFQTIVLIWLSNTLAASFGRISAMSAQIVLHNETLEQKVRDRTLEAEAANQAKSLFLANMSHEIRTPMNAILGFCHLALRTELTRKQQDYVSKIQSAGRSLLGLINDILDFSKIEAGKLTLENINFNLRHSLETPFSIAAVKATEKGIAVHLDVDPTVPETLMGDSHRLNQVVLNLLSNAIKFTESGSVTVTIRTLERHLTTLTLEVAVRDRGIGMTAEQQSRLFRSFSQADSSTTRRFGGTGLGLAISHQLVELMGGTISVQSVLDVGSTFIFTVVMEVGECAPLPGHLPSEQLRHLRVLIADNNSASREILHGTFIGLGMSADLVASGEEALAALVSATAPYDLVLMDWKMPGLNGIETVKAMRGTPLLTTLPTVLMISAYAEDEAKAAAAAAGISGFLIKPIDCVTLRATLTRLFDASKPLTTEPAVAGVTVPMVAPHLRGSRILVAEDNEINRVVAVELLTDAGLLVDIAENGCVACARVMDSDEQYDAILMDIQMPEMDGLEATSRIRQRWPAERLPIIAMTAHAYEAERQRCLDVGMNDHITKPVDPASLVSTLNRWLKPRNASIAAAPASEAPSEPAEELPANLPPFDLDAGLRRMNGKRALLRRLIVNFGDTFADAIPTLRAQITSGAIPDARRLAHTLKGVAGALEIHAVFEAASQAEAALSAAAMDGLENKLDRLEQAMLPALAASASLKAAASPAATPITSPPDYTTVIPTILELREALEHRSLRARTIFQSLERALGPSSATADLRAVKTALARLDYGAALKILDELPGLDDMARFGLAHAELNR